MFLDYLDNDTATELIHWWSTPTNQRPPICPRCNLVYPRSFTACPEH